MSDVVVCELPEGQERWRPDPFPGSDAAIERGCVCPLHQPWPGKLAFSTRCPVHELERLAN